MTDTLDPAIDYDRFASLPAGVPPADLDAAGRAAYFRNLGLRCGFFSYGQSPPANLRDRPPDPDDPLVPQFTPEESMRVRLVGDDVLVVPRAVHVDDPAHATSLMELPQQTLDDACKDWAKAVSLAAGDTDEAIALAVARTLRFDDAASKASGLPIPFLPDESLVLYWPDAVAPPSPSSPVRPGVVDLAVDASGGVSVAALHAADAAARYLLTSPKDAWAGELDPLLLRAPVFGAVRFERYRHLKLEGAGLTLANPSAVGRLVVKGIDRDAAGPAATDPEVVGGQTFVFENVARDGAIASLTALLAHQVRQFASTVGSGGSFVKRPTVRKVVTEHLGTLFRAWLAHARAFTGSVPAGFAAAGNAIRDVANLDFATCRKIAQDVAASPDATSSLLGFLRSVYVPILCGTSWAELGVALPVPADREPRKSSEVDHTLLAELPRSSRTWTVAYAGCPIGRPARVYVKGAVSGPEALLHEGYGTFELEALHIAGLAATQLGVAVPGPSADPIAAVDLAPFVTRSPGRLAWLRIVEPLNTLPSRKSYGRVQELSTRDWLLAAGRGTTRRFFEPPLVEVEPAPVPADAAERHPLVGSLDIDLFAEARRMRALLDAADAATIGGKPLARVSLDFWVARAGLGATWPAIVQGQGIVETAPTPSRPFRKAGTAGRGAVVDTFLAANFPTLGLDFLELEAVLKAARAVRDGREFRPIHPSLLLALLTTEGYREAVRAVWNRMNEFLPTAVARGDFSPGAVDQMPLRRTLGAAVWLPQTFGLDLLVSEVARKPLPKKPTSATPPPGGWIERVNQQFETIVAALTTPTTAGDPGTSIIDATILPKAVLRDYLECALDLRWRPGANAEIRVVSPRSQWVGLALMLGVYQLVHRQIALGVAFPTGDDPAYASPDEYSAPVPGWQFNQGAGLHANSAARRDYVVYHALIYLAFNTSSATLNLWVQAVEDELQRRRTASPGVDPGSVSRLIALWKNAVPRNVEPAGGGAGGRLLAQRGHLLRFAAALDAFSRLDFAGGVIDSADPATRTADPEWKLPGEQ